MSPSVVEPDQGCRQVNKCDAPFTGDLEVGWWPKAHCLFPGGRDVLSAANLGKWSLAGVVGRGEIKTHHLIVAAGKADARVMPYRDHAGWLLVDDITAPVDHFEQVSTVPSSCHRRVARRDRCLRKTVMAKGHAWRTESGRNQLF